ncbi:MAG: hypothetical protein Q8M92_04575, partial [Candidatus Subteraquimicrobiales bacterium]|nr:hypothetical protein [Candidatus Subteraquimicrobiales bacterium]
GDEPFSEEIWKVLKSRKRKGCLTLLPMTPLSVEPFVVDEVEKYAKENRKGYYRLSGSVYDGCRVRGVRGHLEADIIDEMVASYSEDERQARVWGDFMYFSERVYPQISAERHWVEPSDYPLDAEIGKTLQIVDPHDGRPCACIYGQIQRLEHSSEYKLLMREGKAKQQYRYVIFFETPVAVNLPFWDMRKTTSLSEEIEQWIEIEDNVISTEYGQRIDRRVLDRVFGWQTRNSSTISNTFLEEGRKRGHSFVFNPSYSSKGQGSEIAFGHNAVRELLGDLEDGKPGLVIYRNCWHTFNGLTHYIRRRAKNTDVTKAVGETKLVDKYKDFPDVVRFFACEKSYHQEKKSEERGSKRKRRVNSFNILEALGRQL